MWIKKVHRCIKPEKEELALEKLDKGSVWECEEGDCDRRWEFQGFGLNLTHTWKEVTKA